MRLFVSNPDRAAIFAAASRLLQYPDQDLLDRLDTFDLLASRLPGRARKPLLDFIRYLRGTQLLELQASYVETFDLRKRNCLDLTFPRAGDTRRRGMALWDFADLYRRHGYTQTTGDLPDYLPAVLELAALAAPEDREPFETLVRYRPEIVLLRTSLQADSSPYANVLRALEFALPRPGAAVLELARRLAEEGPPGERVGVAPDIVWLGANADASQTGQMPPGATSGSGVPVDEPDTAGMSIDGCEINPIDATGICPIDMAEELEAR